MSEKMRFGPPKYPIRSSLCMRRSKVCVKDLKKRQLALHEAFDLAGEKGKGCIVTMMTEKQGWLTRAENWARGIGHDTVALWIAAHDPRTPWYAKVAAGCVAAYVLSPIDFVPDFIPFLGYLDDLVVIPLGITMVVRLVPADLMAEFRAMAAVREGRPVSRSGAVAIIVIWILAAAALLWVFWPSALAS